MFQLDYKIRSSQLSLLQRQSDIATQTITFRCLNLKTHGFQFLPNDENTAYIDTSSTRYLSSTRIEKSEGCDVCAYFKHCFFNNMGRVTGKDIYRQLTYIL